MQVPNGTGPGVRRSKRPLLASRTRCNVLWKQARPSSVLNSIKSKPIHIQKFEKNREMSEKLNFGKVQ